MSGEPKRELLRHMVATVAFRGRVAVEGSPAEFSRFRVHASARTPGEILAHIGDLLTGTRLLLSGDYATIASEPLGWNEEIARFYYAAAELDDFLASDASIAYPVERFVQGPVGDALTHVGQIVLLRRIFGSPVTETPYFTADIRPLPAS
jgi:hypothetical protein